MKNASKLIAAALLSAGMLFARQTKAQTAPPSSSSPPTSVQLNLGIEGALTTGQETSQHSASIGGSLQLEEFLNPRFAITLTSGYEHFFAKTIPNTDLDYADLNIIPAKLGIKEFFVPNVYFGAEAGAAFVLANGNVKLLASPAIGFTDSNHKWDVSVRYENYFGRFDYGIAGLRIAHCL